MTFRQTKRLTWLTLLMLLLYPYWCRWCCWLIWRRSRLKAEVDGRWFAGGFPCDFWSLPSVSVAHLQHHLPNATKCELCEPDAKYAFVDKFFLPQKLWSRSFFFWQISAFFRLHSFFIPTHLVVFLLLVLLFILLINLWKQNKSGLIWVKLSIWMNKKREWNCNSFSTCTLLMWLTHPLPYSTS